MAHAAAQGSAGTAEGFGRFGDDMVSSSLADRRYRPSPDGFSLAPMAAELDRAFASTPTRGRDEVWRCPHCVTDAEHRALGGPAATLSPALVARFVRKAGTTWGDAAELRRLTPRILTLAADHRLPISRAVVWQKLRWAGWTEWPDDQVEAMGRFLLAEFTRLLRAQPRPAFVADRWLRQVSNGIDDLSGFLTVWHDSIGPLPDPAIQATAVHHLVELLTASPLRPDLPATIADVLPENPAAAEQLTSFLTGPGVDHDLRRAASEAAGTSGSRRINVAVERLRRFRAAQGRAQVTPIAP